MIRSLSSRRRLLALTGAGGSVSILAACGAGTQLGVAVDAAPSAQLKKGAKIVWAIDDGTTRTPLREEQIKLFNAKFPDIGFEKILGATGSEKLVSLFAADTPPDMFRQEGPGLGYFASRKQISSLDPFIKRDKYDLTDFFPTSWLQWTWKGLRYGVPFQGIRNIYYNRALATQINVKFPNTWKDPNWTFEVFLDAAKKATLAQGTSATRWGVAEIYTIRRQWSPWVWGNGGELFNEDGTKILLDQPPAMEAIQFIADLIHRHRVMPTPDELRSQGGQAGLFQAGNLLAYHNSVNNVALNRRTVTFDWSMSSVPHGKGKPSRAGGGGVGWFMTAASKVKDETWELMKLLASKESVRLEAQRGEAPPSRRSVANEPEFISPPEPPRGDMKVIVEALESVHTENVMINGTEIDAILDRELGQIWTGQRTAKESVAQAVGLIKPLLNPPG